MNIYNFLVTNINEKKLSICSPYGKTSSLYPFIKNYRHILGNIIIIYPSVYYINQIKKIYKYYIENLYIKFITVEESIEYLVENKFNLDLVILDYLYFSNDYHSLLSFVLKINIKRLYILSSIIIQHLNTNYLEEFKNFNLYENINFTNNFNIFYLQDNFINYYYPKTQLSRHLNLILNVCNQNINNRILIIVATQDECIKLYNYLISYIKSIPIYKIYKHISSRNIKIIENELINNEPAIFISTMFINNFVFTLNLNILVDLGTELEIISENKQRINWCNKNELGFRLSKLSNLYECKIYRLFSQTHYNNMYDNFMYNSSHNTIFYLESNYYNTLDIIGWNTFHIKNELLSWKSFESIIIYNIYKNTKLHIRQCCILFQLYKQYRHFNQFDFLLILKSIILINYFYTSQYPLPYTQYHLLNKTIYPAMNVWKTIINEKDDLCLYINLILINLLNTNHNTHNLLKLNPIFLHKFKNTLKLCLKFFFPNEFIDWRFILKNNLSFNIFNETKIFEFKNNHRLLFTNFYSKLDYIFKINRISPIYHSFFNKIYFDYNLIIKPDKYTNKLYIPLSINIINNNSICNLFIYYYNNDNENLMEQIKNSTFQQELEKKRFWKEKFTNCKLEIENLVAYYPNNYKFLEEILNNWINLYLL